MRDARCTGPTVLGFTCRHDTGPGPCPEPCPRQRRGARGQEYLGCPAGVGRRRSERLVAAPPPPGGEFRQADDPLGRRAPRGCGWGGHRGDRPRAFLLLTSVDLVDRAHRPCQSRDQRQRPPACTDPRLTKGEGRRARCLWSISPAGAPILARPTSLSDLDGSDIAIAPACSAARGGTRS